METKNSKFEQQMVNPVLKSALKSNDVSENCITYKSVFRKTGLFLLVVLGGIAVAMVLHLLLTKTIASNDGVFTASSVEVALLVICSILSFVMPIVASFSNRAAGICGSFACFAYGYILGFLAVAFKGYQGPMLLALAITIALVASMLILYRFRVIKVTNRFMSIVWVLFLTMFLASFLLLICYFIPGLSSFVSSIWSNPWLSIGFGIFGVVIGCLFLLCDFRSIEDAVEYKLDKSYENRLAFGLAFSVIWLYFKVLELILRILQFAKN